MNIHKWLDNIEPLGWQFQVSNDIVINYNVKYEKMLISKEKLEAAATGAFKAGTLYDLVSGGGMFRAGWFDAWSSSERERKFNCYITGWGEARAVGYNATLQGGMFNRDNIYTIPAEDIRRLVVSGGGSIFIGFKGFMMEYFKTWISPEFKNGLSHGWGGIGLRFDI